MTDHETAVAITQGDEIRAAAQAELNAKLLEIKRRQSLVLTAAVCIALVAVVFGVVIPVVLDKADSDKRRADLNTLAIGSKVTACRSEYAAAVQVQLARSVATLVDYAKTTEDPQLLADLSDQTKKLSAAADDYQAAAIASQSPQRFLRNCDLTRDQRVALTAKLPSAPAFGQPSTTTTTGG